MSGRFQTEIMRREAVLKFYQWYAEASEAYEFEGVRLHVSEEWVKWIDQGIETNKFPTEAKRWSRRL